MANGLDSASGWGVKVSVRSPNSCYYFKLFLRCRGYDGISNGAFGRCSHSCSDMYVYMMPTVCVVHLNRTLNVWSVCLLNPLMWRRSLDSFHPLHGADFLGRFFFASAGFAMPRPESRSAAALLIGCCGQRVVLLWCHVTSRALFLSRIVFWAGGDDCCLIFSCILCFVWLAFDFLLRSNRLLRFGLLNPNNQKNTWSTIHQLWVNEVTEIFEMDETVPLPAATLVTC